MNNPGLMLPEFLEHFFHEVQGYHNKSTFRLITIVRPREYYNSRGDNYGINNRSKRFKKVL